LSIRQQLDFAAAIGMNARRFKVSATQASRTALAVVAVNSHDRIRLSSRLRNMLSDHPHVRHFTVARIMKALGPEDGPAVALFSAAGVFETPEADILSARLTAGLGARLALGPRRLFLPQAVLQRKIPRNSLALLIHSLCAVLENLEAGLRERWTWMFNPLMSGVLGLVLFLLGLASMAPIVGGGVQHAASAFLVAVGMAERDGLVAMIGALVGLASIALAVLSALSGKRLWAKIKAWLLRCAKWLHLRALAQLLNHCCEGVGDLLRLRWSGLLLLMFAPAPPLERLHDEYAAESTLRRRVRRAKMVAERAHFRLTAKAHGP
jgi:hypothetical protein